MGVGYVGGGEHPAKSTQPPEVNHRTGRQACDRHALSRQVVDELVVARTQVGDLGGGRGGVAMASAYQHERLGSPPVEALEHVEDACRLFLVVGR